MRRTAEKGHAKNVANLEDLISFCTAYGAAYNPTRANLKLPALNTLHATSVTVIANVNTAFSPYVVALNTRAVAFKNLNDLLIRASSAAYTLEISKKTKSDIQSLVKKLSGRRIGEKRGIKLPDGTLTQEPETPRTHTTSQMSFDSRIENFDKFIQLLKNLPAYAPNETELNVASLTATHTGLRTINNAVQTTYVTLTNARYIRNKTLYVPKTGLHEVAQSAKTYVRSLFGHTSTQFKQVRKIKFYKMRD